MVDSSTRKGGAAPPDPPALRGKGLRHQSTDINEFKGPKIKVGSRDCIHDSLTTVTFMVLTIRPLILLCYPRSFNAWSS